MAASSMCQNDSSQFMRWLEARLLQLNADLDVSVFVMYICGILDSYSGYDDKKESLLDIVGEIADEDKEAVCDELIQKWDEMSSSDSKQDELNKKTAMDEKLSQMLCNTHVTTSSAEKKSKQLSEEEKARKEAILAQYSNICDEVDLDAVEPVEDVVDAGGAAPSTTAALIAVAAVTTNSAVSGHLMQNLNKENVIKREKELRDKLKEDNEKKKGKDKQDRETQKNKKQDRKDMEKKRTQKGERRR